MARKGIIGEQVTEALVVGSLTVGILLLFLLQFALPSWLGPGGLVLAIFVDATIYLEMRHRRAARMRARASRWAAGHPLDRPPVTRGKRHLADEYVTAIALLLFAIGLSIEGLSLQALDDHPGSATNFVFFQVGVAVLVIGDLLLWPYEWRFYDWRTESEKYDTTDDH